MSKVSKAVWNFSENLSVLVASLILFSTLVHSVYGRKFNAFNAWFSELTPALHLCWNQITCTLYFIIRKLFKCQVSSNQQIGCTSERRSGRDSIIFISLAWGLGNIMLQNILEYTSLQTTVVYTLSQNNSDTKAKKLHYAIFYFLQQIQHTQPQFQDLAPPLYEGLIVFQCFPYSGLQEISNYLMWENLLMVELS